MRKKNLKGRTVHLKLRYDNFSTITRNKTLPIHTDSTEMIFDTILQLFKKNYQSGRKVRLIGAGMSGFDEEEGEQLSLFNTKRKSTTQLDKLQDQLSDRFGKKIISRAESMNKRDHDFISPFSKDRKQE